MDRKKDTNDLMFHLKQNVQGYDACCDMIYFWVQKGYINQKQMAELIVDAYKRYVY